MSTKTRLFDRYSPSALLIMSFLLVIVTGTVLLCLPFSRNTNIPFIDLLFTSVTSTCVTGLITITPMLDLSILGQIVVLLMIQIGGLGLMTFIAIALLMLDGKLDYSERSLLKDSLNKYDFDNVSGYIKRILKYTFTTELIGFLVLAIRIYDGSLYSLFQSLFLSISAFCNAGIDIFGSSSLIAYQSDVLVNIVVSLLIILGGIGFIVWLDIFENTKKVIKDKSPLRYIYRDLNVHSKVVLATSLVLILSGMAFIFIFEYNASFKDLSFFDKILASYFNSVTLRTAGFATVNYQTISEPTKLLMLPYMLVGASPGGTGGGFKTTTLFMIVFCVYAEVKHKKKVNVYKRHIPKATIIKSITIIVLYMAALFVGIIALSYFENIEIMDLIYEACSAIGTVGLSTGATSLLDSIGKVIIMVLMFIGRVGPITLLFIVKKDKETEKTGVRYPKADIIVG